MIVLYSSRHSCAGRKSLPREQGECFGYPVSFLDLRLKIPTEILQTPINSINQRLIPRALPPRRNIIHHITKAQLAIGIPKAR